MSFMLGSFTSGMFSGMNDVQDAFLKNEEYKRSKMETQRQSDMMAAAKAVTDAQSQQQAQNAVNQSGAGAPQAGINLAPTSTSTTTTAPRTPVTKVDLNSVPQPAYMTAAATQNTVDHAQSERNYGSGTAQATGVMPGGQPVGGVNTSALDQERSGYGVQGPNPGANPQAQSMLPKAPTMTAPSNMQTYDVPMSQFGALSSGQGTPQASAVRSAPPVQGGAGPDLSHLNNNPVGSTLGNWIHGRTNAPAYLPNRPATSPAAAMGAPQVSQALPTRPGAMAGAPSQMTPSMANSTGGLGQQILAALNPSAAPNG